VRFVRGNFLGKKSISFILITIFGFVLLSFQNCSKPLPLSQSQSTSSNNNQNTGDTTPGLIRPGETEDPIDPNPIPAVLSRTQEVGTAFNERAWAVLETSTGHFVTVGRINDATNTNAARDVLLHRYKADGTVDYSVRIGDGFEQQSYKIIQFDSTSYLIAGLTRTVIEADEDRSTDILLVRVNAEDGEVLEAHRYGDTNVEIIHDIIKTTDGSGLTSLVAVGQLYNRTTQIKSAMAIKFDNSLNIVWTQAFGEGNSDFVLTSLTHVNGYGYYAVGYRNRTANKDSLILRFSYSGSLYTARILDNLTHEDSLRDVAWDNINRQIVAVGRLNGNGRNGEGAVHRFTPSLTPIGTQIVGSASGLDQFMDINTLPEGGFVLSGMTTSSPDNSGQDNFIIKIKSDNTIGFLNTFGTNGSDQNQYHSLVRRKDSGYAMISNHADATNGGMSPVLLLIDQYGSIPTGCGSQTLTNPTFTVDTSTTFQWQTFNMTPTDITLLDDTLDSTFEGSEIALDQTTYCVN